MEWLSTLRAVHALAVRGAVGVVRAVNFDVVDGRALRGVVVAVAILRVCVGEREASRVNKVDWRAVVQVVLDDPLGVCLAQRVRGLARELLGLLAAVRRFLMVVVPEVFEVACTVMRSWSPAATLIDVG